MARAAGLSPIVVWPRNNWCGAAYGQIFRTPLTTTALELKEFIARPSNFCFVMNEDHLRSGVDFCSPLSASSLDKVLDYSVGKNSDVFYHTPLIPPWMDMQLVLQTIKELHFQDCLWHRVHAFLDQHNLTDFIGVHIRKTDFGAYSSDDDGLFKLLANCPQKRFFVCSDNEAVENRFSSLPNTVTYTKRAYVERRVAGDWNTPTTDHSGRVYACNVERNALSVEDAVIDLLVLSYSQILESSQSTFRNAAIFIKSALQLDGKQRSRSEPSTLSFTPDNI